MSGKKDIVVFVDDELHILNAIRRAVIDEPFISLFANSGKEALELFETYEISVIVTDMRMPGMDGLTLLKQVRELSPKTVRIVLSGYTQLSQVLVTVNQAEIFQFISKPWQTEEELLIVVRRGIERYNLEAERDSLRQGLQQKNAAIMNVLREMEQKLANEKKDIASIKHISYWLFAFWKRHFAVAAGYSQEIKEKHARDIELIETIHFAYMTVLPSVFAGRTVSQAVAELGNACAGRMKLALPSETDPVIWGYFDVLCMIMKIVIFLHEPDVSQVAAVDMTLRQPADDSIVLIFTGIPSAQAKLDQPRLRIGYALLNEIGKNYNVKLTANRAGAGQDIELLQIQWTCLPTNRTAAAGGSTG